MSTFLYPLLISLAILLPNVLFVLFPPRDQPSQLKDGGIIMNVLEHGGRIAFFGLFLFSKPNDKTGLDSIFFALMILFILSYYALWFRYFLLNRNFANLFDRVVGIPVPMAILPLLALFFASLWLGATLALPALAFFAFGHLYNSFLAVNQATQTMPSSKIS